MDPSKGSHTRGETEEEVCRRAAEHAKERGAGEVTTDAVERIKENIRDFKLLRGTLSAISKLVARISMRIMRIHRGFGRGYLMDDLQRLIQKYEKEIAQLQAHVGEIKHKLDIMVEASRLLEEEVLVPHRTLYEKISDACEEKD